LAFATHFLVDASRAESNAGVILAVTTQHVTAAERAAGIIS